MTMTNGRPSPDDLLSAYHDGELSPAEREAAERLLEESADARAELEDYRALSELLRGQPSEHAPAGLHAAVMRRIERESAAAPAKPVPAPVASRRLRRGLFALAGGLTAVAGVLLAVNLSNDRFGPQRGDRPAGGAAMSEAVPTAAPALAESVAPMALDSAPRGFEVRDAAPAGDLPDDGVESAAAEIAGAEARPPEEVSPGDVYRYLEQNAEGEVVVVQATVVDVRRAMRHFQVLLQRNEIPTVPVDFDAAASAGLPAASDRGLALYVESDPSQINEALRQLEAEPGGFLGFQVRGVLPTPPAGAGVEGEMRLSAGDAAQPSRSETPAAGRASRQGEGDETRAESVAEQEDLVRPQARGSVPAERFGRAAAPPPAAAGAAGGRPLLPEPADAPEVPFGAAAEPSVDRQTRFLFENGYQQVVPVPQDLSKQLRPVHLGAKLAAEAERPQTDLRFYAESAERLREGSGPERADLKRDLEQAARQVQRRHRLLVVLEPQPGDVKAKADSAPPPVEAPQPPRKKG